MNEKRRESKRFINSITFGFSITELMIVLVILAIFAAFQYPSYKESLRKSKRAQAHAALTEVLQQQARHHSQHSTYVIFSSSASNGFKWYSGDTPKSSAYELSSMPCKNTTIKDCVQVIAKPGTGKVDSSYKDDICGDLIIASDGTKSTTGIGNDCW